MASIEQINPPVEEPEVYTLRLTANEMLLVRTVMGLVAGSPDRSARKYQESISDELSLQFGKDYTQTKFYKYVYGNIGFNDFNVGDE